MATGEPIGPVLIRRLMLRGEGVDVDYKRDQYQFPKGPEHKRADLLKDILAFANATRSDDAHILIGIDEDDQKRPVIVGTDDHFNPADLQQFVNTGKLNRLVDFHYVVVDVDGKRIGVLRIPVQQRPFYAKKPFGTDPQYPTKPAVVREGVVYYRRGDSTFEATPEVIYDMGRTDTATDTAVARIKLFFADIDAGVPTATTHQTQHEYLDYDDADLPDWPAPEGVTAALMETNTNFFRDAAKFLWFEAGFRPLYFAAKNSGDAVATDVGSRVDRLDSGFVLLIGRNFGIGLRGFNGFNDLCGLDLSLSFDLHFGDFCGLDDRCYTSSGCFNDRHLCVLLIHVRCSHVCVLRRPDERHLLCF